MLCFVASDLVGLVVSLSHTPLLTIIAVYFFQYNYSHVSCVENNTAMVLLESIFLQDKSYSSFLPTQFFVCN